MSQLPDAHTPRLRIVDSRGLIVRLQAFHRSTQAATPAPRVTCQTFDLAGRLISRRDPRLSAPNQKTIYSLPGQMLCSESVDAGWRLALLGEAGQPVEDWDGRGSVRRISYDALLRPLAITEQNRVAERFMYGGPDLAEHNQCNRLIRHDDTAGTRLLTTYGMFTAPLTETRHFTTEGTAPGWPESPAERDELLEAQGLQSRWGVNAVGETLTQTDAAGNIRHWGWTLAGQPEVQSVNLVASAQPQILVDKISYNAFNQVEEETAGNGVVSRYTYDPRDGRLLEIRAGLADSPPLQHLKYTYDPVGNILQIEDAAQPIRFFANQRIEPVSNFRYDTLYQLIEATGREVKTGSSHGPALPGLQNLPTDPTQIANYTQRYDYDAAGNLLQMRHIGAQNFTRTLRVAPDSNRSLPQGDVEMDFADAFDANGNLLQLVRGQALSWNARNQLQQINTVVRAKESNDSETYIYDGQGQRCREITSAQARNRTLLAEVRYLPGLEVRTRPDGEILHVITAQAGRISVRVLHWQAGKPDAIVNDQMRYSLSDHLGSSTLELDQHGGLISQESYYPFGGTAWWAARSAVEAKYKTVRYSGKERDASGLYYYGFRYYAPWLCRWISPDPAGDVDGLNLFGFVGNNPINFFDPDGQDRDKARARWSEAIEFARELINPSDVSVKTFAPGIIAVSVEGTNETFEQIGMGLPRTFNGRRQLMYLSIDSTHQSKVSGGSQPIAIKSASGAEIYAAAEVPGSDHLAYINGGFYNMGKKASPSHSSHAAIGKVFMGGQEKASVSIPAGYENDYVALTMGDGSILHSAPLLSTGGEVAFTESDLQQPRFQYGPATSAPGQLGHANTPNQRSGISFPAVFDGSSRTRLAIGLGGSRTPESKAYTMPEWARIMTRLDKLNGTPGWSVNLDGGDSVALGVVSRSGEKVMHQSASGNFYRGIGNFLTFYK